MKFKVGDSVRVLNKKGTPTGEIVETFRSGEVFAVDIGAVLWFSHSSQLELVERKEKKLFEVGDKVRIVKKISCPGAMWYPEMDKTIGEEGTVVAYCDVDDTVKVEIGQKVGWYTPEALKAVIGFERLWGRPYMVKDIYVNEKKRTTVVIFSDGSKKIVKCGEDEKFDVYTAVTAAISEKIYGTNSALKRAIEEKTIDQKPKKEPKKASVDAGEWLEDMFVDKIAEYVGKTVEEVKTMLKDLKENK